MSLRKARLLAATLCVALCVTACASAETRMYTFPTEEIPQELLVPPENTGDVTVRMSFAGDACLGVEEYFFGYPNNFVAQVRAKGYDYPFAKLKPLFDQDDITLINLETVLSDAGNLPKADKRYVFRGPTDMAKILTAGGVECVSIENNHILDEGERGREHTIAALEQEKVGYVDAQNLTVLEKDGVRVGFFGFQFSLYSKHDIVKAQIAALQRAGCGMIVMIAHLGQEYGFQINAAQKALIDFLEGKGVALVIGHHPHVPQGVVRKADMQYALSLGNFCFGSNSRPKDYDALVATVDAAFENGVLKTQQMTLWPITISQILKGNDFQPGLVNDKRVNRILTKMQRSANYELPPYEEGKGFVQPVLTMPETITDMQTTQGAEE